ncbi:hypothetical protein GBM44_05000 [Enterococcus faecium]|nr:hypothetical protein CXR19_00295 [Enterococcus faecium]KAB7617345.1 hypothetical protein GBM44_05000 [Enterococcus faecium]PNN23403.1 hypothetical protein AL496_008960 [Enterococcus faecium]
MLPYSSPSIFHILHIISHDTYALIIPQVELEKKINHTKKGSIIYGTDESELILQPHFYFRY